MTGGLTVRVWVTDVWDHVSVPVTPEKTFAEVKAGVLAQTVGTQADPGEYEMKYRGALVTDETQTLGTAAVPDGAPMIVLPVHRRPVH